MKTKKCGFALVIAAAGESYLLRVRQWESRIIGDASESLNC